ncbi:WD repeat, SAM and U-box domain-containing protein 1-like isoform X1 [Tribolium madens]|uniref:WD repeat, SAM and U-box domain-containing protein 1-like isoform X1 n=1 Tax=Tribolium madens TaxID=41895 RepID=UPI001CF75122|nr:WD repeat, SAM and U-box domain-containing protein 1-like isoform X1 [Tribolium madens]XP_044265115.1 WD repeat, SAM and U-box domain-containing protein 1-like isoform X1 [Tribolium madens]XP_044265116.1 WD repeat, SAM and U-box domain-containing protein 1-like isoform X1 [Tribolium madens]
MSITGNEIKIIQSLSGHRSDVTSCDFASDYTLVTGSSDKTIRLWEWVRGSGYVERSYSPLRGHKYQVTCVRISPQGAMLASASVDGTAILWNLHSGIKIYTMVQVNGDAIRVCRFAPDSSILVTAGDNGAVCVWDLVHRSLIRTIVEHEGTTTSLTFTPDSQYLISACSLEVLKIWYVQDLVDTTSDSSCCPVAKCENAHDLGVVCAEISKKITTDEDDPLIKRYTMATSGNSNEIKIWTITSKSTPKHKNTINEVAVEYCDSFDGHNSSVTCIRYTNSGAYLVSSSLDKLVKIWDEEGNCVATLRGHTRYVNCVAVSKDCLLAASGSTGSNDKLILVWDLTGNLTTESELVKPLRLSFNSVGTIPEFQLMRNAESNDNEVKLLEKIDDVSEGAINCCAFNNSGILATGSGDKLVRLFRVVEENNNVEELNYSPLEGHTYPVNYVEFSRDGSKLASCSLDGGTNIWNSETGEKIASLPENSLSLKVCRFSPDGNFLITAGDDEKATIWDSEFKPIATLEGHLDAVTSASFTPDGAIIATTSFNADFRLWKNDSYESITVKEDAHDYGIQSCDFSQNLEPVPNNIVDVQSYLLGTCGNDGFVKLWRISLPKKSDELEFDEIEIKVWRVLRGHGGNVICVRFSPNVSEIICSTATDRQARIWSVYSAECLYVLDHDSIVTACAFSSDCSLVATGCIDKTLWLWKMPQQLVFRTIVATKIQCRTKALIDWSTSDVIKWLKNMDLGDVVENAQNTSLDGQKILTLSEEQICSGLELSEEQAQRLSRELRWLKQDELQISQTKNCEIPHEFLCPITHEIMREPVTCSDGFTYEKNAICEWFMSGKYSSPLTNEILTNTEYTYNHELRNSIHSFLEQDD